MQVARGGNELGNVKLRPPLRGFEFREVPFSILEFADTSPLGDADAFEHGRQNSKNCPQLPKKVRAE